MAYVLSWEESGAITKFYGAVTLKEINEVNDKHYGNSQFDEIRYIFFDFTEADLAPMTLDDVKYPAAFDKAASIYRPYIKLALAVKDKYSKSLCEEYVRLSKALGNEWEFAIFDNHQDAMRWCLR